MLDKVIHDTVYRCGVVRSRLINPSGVNLNGTDAFQLIVILFNYFFVQGNDDSCVVSALYQCVRQTCHDICQTACLNERQRFSPDKQN